MKIRLPLLVLKDRGFVLIALSPERIRYICDGFAIKRAVAIGIVGIVVSLA